MSACALQLSASCQDLLRRMLTPQPEQRITLQQVSTTFPA